MKTELSYVCTFSVTEELAFDSILAEFKPFCSDRKTVTLRERICDVNL